MGGVVFFFLSFSLSPDEGEGRGVLELFVCVVNQLKPSINY